ncbi:MAG: hypothetical protein FD174_1118 [Geobacteraceae bacterium]|nr:MAG: hypothetical protein FD174_1118 [Geobacteraceae bacterium]
MRYDITGFKKLDGYRLELEFENGQKGMVDLRPMPGVAGYLPALQTWSISTRFR